MNNAILFGVGMGPGDPKLITMKAVSVIRDCKNIAFQGTNSEENICCNIASEYISLSDKNLIPCTVPMTKDAALLDKAYEEIVRNLAPFLERGEDVAYLTLGDPTIYASYIYIQDKINRLGYHSEIINGVTSFCAVAARLGISLAERGETLQIFPASYETDEIISSDGTVVLMKSASSLPLIKEKLAGCTKNVYAVQNCGLKNERIYHGADNIDDNAGYLTTLIIK